MSKFENDVEEALKQGEQHAGEPMFAVLSDTERVEAFVRAFSHWLRTERDAVAKAIAQIHGYDPVLGMSDAWVAGYVTGLVGAAVDTSGDALILGRALCRAGALEMGLDGSEVFRGAAVTHGEISAHYAQIWEAAHCTHPVCLPESLKDRINGIHASHDA